MILPSPSTGMPTGTSTVPLQDALLGGSAPADLPGLALAAGAALAYAALVYLGWADMKRADLRRTETVRRAPAWGLAMVGMAAGLHGLAIVWALWGGPLRFGFAPALSVTVWLVTVVYAVESRLYPQLQAHWVLSALGAAVVLLPLAFPGHLLHANASAWLPLHWALGIASYGLFGVAVVHGMFMTQAENKMRHADPPASAVPLLTLERLTFRFVTAGFVLLSATLLVAAVFAEQLYGVGAGWKFNHKTVFSVLSWLTFALLLAGRQWMGWRGNVALRFLYTGAGLLLMAYVGSRFVLEVVLKRSL